MSTIDLEPAGSAADQPQAGEPERLRGRRIEIGSDVNPPGFDDELIGLGRSVAKRSSSR